MHSHVPTLEHGFMFIACFLQEPNGQTSPTPLKCPFADLGSKVALVILASNYLVSYKKKKSLKYGN